MTEKKIIGNAEYAWLVEPGIKKVPARIDTGARTSAVWASDVTETGNGLQYRLFGIRSPFYTGEYTVQKHYSKVAVASSNGHVQVRYRVPMTIQICGRRVKTHCTLADRSTQAFPILIGRNTLRGKFIVDVQRGPLRLKMLDAERVSELQAIVDGNMEVV